VKGFAAAHQKRSILQGHATGMGAISQPVQWQLQCDSHTITLTGRNYCIYIVVPVIVLQVEQARVNKAKAQYIKSRVVALMEFLVVRAHAEHMLATDVCHMTPAAKILLLKSPEGARETI
jgi:hypothetical protein